MFEQNKQTQQVKMSKHGYSSQQCATIIITKKKKQTSTTLLMVSSLLIKIKDKDKLWKTKKNSKQIIRKMLQKKVSNEILIIINIHKL